MKKPTTPAFVPLRNLRVTDLSSSRLSLRSHDATLQVETLADDLFHLRLLRTGEDPEPSWAVVRDAWPPVRTRTLRRGPRLALETDAARFSLHTTTGAWSLVDVHGIEIFSALADAWGFAETRPRITLRLADREIVHGLGETSRQRQRSNRIKARFQHIPPKLPFQVGVESL